MKTKLYSQKLFVSLGSTIYPNRFEQMSQNGRIEELSKPTDFIYFEVSSLLEAKLLSQEFIRNYNLGGSNWIGGRIINECGDFVAIISYNGKVWDNEDWKLANEIKIC